MGDFRVEKSAFLSWNECWSSVQEHVYGNLETLEKQTNIEEFMLIDLVTEVNP